MKVVIAPQGFKGGISGLEAAKAIARGVVAVVPDAETVLLPVADGGDADDEDDEETEALLRKLIKKLAQKLGVPAVKDLDDSEDDGPPVLVSDSDSSDDEEEPESVKKVSLDKEKVFVHKIASAGPVLNDEPPPRPRRAHGQGPGRPRAAGRSPTGDARASARAPSPAHSR